MRFVGAVRLNARRFHPGIAGRINTEEVHDMRHVCLIGLHREERS
jgi:hypothetical protein